MGKTSIISVSGVTKAYKLGTLTSIADTARNALRRLSRKEILRRNLFTALDSVDFEVQPGEVLGIIGHNGAGKSTLLKILAGVVTPTSGSLEVRGKIAPLIEVGAGLVPDMTGRENIYLNGAILGMKRQEIAKKFDDIVAFAELEEFIDTPIKRYSSGMQVRIGFAVATAVDVDILIVDEVLAVGDLAFQRKCFDRIEDIIKRRGNTVLLVSHNIRQVNRLCSRVILLDHGKLLSDGKPAAITEQFYEQSNRKIQEDQSAITRAATKFKSSGEVDFLSIDVCDGEGHAIHEITTSDPLRVRVRLRANTALRNPEIIIGTHTTDFVYLTAGTTGLFDDRPDLLPGEHKIEYCIDSFPLIAGTYCTRLAIFDAKGRMVFAGETLSIFHVRPLPGESRQPPARTLHVPAHWRINDAIFSEQIAEPGLPLNSGTPHPIWRS